MSCLTKYGRLRLQTNILTPILTPTPVAKKIMTPTPVPTLVAKKLMTPTPATLTPTQDPTPVEYISIHSLCYQISYENSDSLSD